MSRSAVPTPATMQSTGFPMEFKTNSAKKQLYNPKRTERPLFNMGGRVFQVDQVFRNAAILSHEGDPALLQIMGDFMAASARIQSQCDWVEHPKQISYWGFEDGRVTVKVSWKEGRDIPLEVDMHVSMRALVVPYFNLYSPEDSDETFICIKPMCLDLVQVLGAGQAPLEDHDSPKRGSPGGDDSPSKKIRTE